MRKAKNERTHRFRLPLFSVHRIFAVRSQVVDWGLPFLQVPDIHQSNQGAGVKIAVLDTGVALRHPDLMDQLEAVRDFTGSRFGPDDKNGHGSHTLGSVLARNDAGGCVGYAPQARGLVGKVLGDDGMGDFRWIAAGADWAVDNGADIISMSLGSDMPSKSIEGAIKRALARQIYVICAAGNAGPDPDTDGWPARIPGVISVAAHDKHGKIAPFSSRGKSVAVAAPGVDVTSCWPPNTLATISGTSMATPAVAGIVALHVASMKAKGLARLTPDELLKRISETSTDIDAPGRDPHSGWGIINPSKLVIPPEVPIEAPGRDPVPAPIPEEWTSWTARDFTPGGWKKFQKQFGSEANRVTIFRG